jgi:TolB-like protein/Flp pilus assembly protein TadD
MHSALPFRISVNWRIWPIAAVFASAAVIAAVILETRSLIRQTPSRANIQRVNSVAVLPLENLSRDPDQEFFADGMTDALITQLAQVKALRVISRTSAMRYKRNRRPLRDVARELGVNAVVEGAVLRSATRVRITADLIDATTDQHLWAKSFERDLRDVIDLQNEVAREIAASIRAEVSPDERILLTERQPVNPIAYENYLRGRYFWNRRTAESMKTGLEYFKSAVEIDPAYALGYAGIADSYAMLGAYDVMRPKEAYPRAQAAAMKALEINPKLAEPHATLLAVELDYDWNWPAVEREYRAAMDINRSYVTAHQWYGTYLSALGFHQKALREMEAARQLDPLSPVANTGLAVVLYQARQYDRAANECRRVLELEPRDLRAHWYLGNIYDEQGLRDAAIAEREIAVKLSGGQPRYRLLLARSLALAGRVHQARALVDDVERGADKEYVSPLEMTFAYVALGDHERALSSLEAAREDRSWGMYRLKVDPKLDPIRNDSRFIAILRSMKFPEDAPAPQ